MLDVEAGGRALLLYDVAGTVFATSAICPHHAAFLSQGHVSGESIECPRHMGRFHIPTGRQERGPPCPTCVPTRFASRTNGCWSKSNRAG
jgi:nitrite reductase/ring-hydroxylating ferredoxin subunit